MYFSGKLGRAHLAWRDSHLVLPDPAPAKSGRLLKAKMQRILVMRELRGSEWIVPKTDGKWFRQRPESHLYLTGDLLSLRLIVLIIYS